MPNVAELAGACDATAREPADPNLWNRLGTGREVSVLEGPILAPEVALARPDRAEEPQCLVHAAPTVFEILAEKTELGLVPADSDAEEETSSRELLQAGRLLGQLDRMVERHADDRCSELHPLQPAGEIGEAGKRVECPGVVPAELPGDEHSLAHPDVVEGERLGRLRDLGQGPWRGLLAGVGEHDAELECAFFCVHRAPRSVSCPSSELFT